jgi:hypothetical protein
MRLNRRNWLKLLVSGSLVGAVGAVAVSRRLRIKLQAITESERRTFTRIVDLLIPSDGAPGAIDLGVHLAVLGKVESNRWDSQLVAEAFLWLDRQSGGEGFLGLDEARQIALLTRMEAEPQRSVPARAFRLLRTETMTRYYAMPETWPSLGFNGTPQPAGFMDYAEPPARRSE